MADSLAGVEPTVEPVSTPQTAVVEPASSALGIEPVSMANMPAGAMLSPLNQDGTTNLQLLAQPGDSVDIAELDKRRVRFTNIGSVQPALNDTQAQMFWGNPATPPSGWLVCAVATPDLFNEDCPISKLPNSLMSILTEAPSLYEARWLTDGLLQKYKPLKMVDIVAIPIGRAIAIPFTVDGTYVTAIDNAYKGYKWVFEGDDAPDGVDEGTARKAIGDFDMSVTQNVPIALRYQKRWSLGRHKWIQFLKDMIKLQTQNRSTKLVSKVFYEHVGDTPGNVFLRGPAFCKSLIENYEKTRKMTCTSYDGTVLPATPYTLMFARFGYIEEPAPSKEAYRSIMNSFNMHLSSVEIVINTLGQYPFEESDIKEHYFADDQHEQINKDAVKRGNLDFLVKSGDSTVAICDALVPMYVYMSEDSNGNLQRMAVDVSPTDMAKFLQEQQEVHAKTNKTADSCIAKVAAELEKIKSDHNDNFVEYCDKIRNTLRVDPAQLNNSV